MKFPPEFDKKVSYSSFFYLLHVQPTVSKVDMRKVNLTVIRPWIAKKIVELVGFEDEVVVEYAMGLLEDEQQPVGLLLIPLSAPLISPHRLLTPKRCRLI